MTEARAAAIECSAIVDGERRRGASAGNVGRQRRQNPGLKTALSLSLSPSLPAFFGVWILFEFLRVVSIRDYANTYDRRRLLSGRREMKMVMKEI